MNLIRKRFSASLVCMATIWTAHAQTDGERIEQLERQVEALSMSLEQRELGSLFPEITESEYGFGPGASKVYNAEPGSLSIGGYGEIRYKNKEEGSDEFDALRGVIYMGYKYTDQWVFNSEIEFEHGSTSKEGSASLEFATIDYLASDVLNARAGLLLVPMGLVNKLHEPTTFLSTQRPETEKRIIPSTWRENGAGIFGDLGGGLSYEAYIVNGLKGEDFDDSGFRGGRQKGSEAVADNMGYVARIDWDGATGLNLGGSAYTGDSGQDSGIELDTTIVEAHADYRFQGLHLRGLFAAATLDGAAELNALRAEAEEVDVSEIDSAGEDLVGWYAELGYDILNTVNSGEASLTPFVRYEEINTQDSVPEGGKINGKRDRQITTIGVAFQPIDELIFKLDYLMNDSAAGDLGNQVNLGLGYVF